MVPKGFLFAAVSCGLKKSDQLDLGLIFCPQGARCAGVFTQNLVKAAPVVLGEERVRRGFTRGILVNSGCANACTGVQGLEDARNILEELAKVLDISAEEILPASTGVIGARLPVEKMSKSLPKLVKKLSPEGYEHVARAMMTTDTMPKVVERTFELPEGSARILGLAKGAGMIAPHMATMLAFVLTDVQIDPEYLTEILRKAVEHSFNRITVDGDTSTNDTVYALASGLAGLEVHKGTKVGALFAEALTDTCKELARLIVKDGEGAHKLVTICVQGASTEEKALQLARIVADSLLVKTAIFGEDPNWGRILAAMGRAGILFDPNQVDIYIDQVQIVSNGLGLGNEAERAAHLVMKNSEFAILIDLKEGVKEANILTCDLSYDYVRINAEYRT